MWRWVRAGRVETVRVGRRLFVRPPSAHRRLGEAAAAYGEIDLTALLGEPRPGPWPYTPEKLEERRRVLLEERRAAFAETDRLAVPVPRGYVERLIREVRGENRAWDGLRRGERAMQARERRRPRQ